MTIGHRDGARAAGETVWNIAVPFHCHRTSATAVPRSDIVFFSFFTRCPRKIINSTLLFSSARTHFPYTYTSLSLSPAVFFPSILNGSDNKCYSAVVDPRTNTLNPPIGRREPAPSSCAAICNYHNSVRLVFFITHTHTNTSCVRKHTHTEYRLYVI